MRTGGWLTKKRGAIKGRASFTNIQMSPDSLKKNLIPASTSVTPSFMFLAMHTVGTFYFYKVTNKKSKMSLGAEIEDQTDLMDQL